MNPPSQQRTLASDAHVEGVGLFTAVPVRARFRPAPPNHGIAFVRTDLEDALPIPAIVGRVVPAQHRTALAVDGARIETVEHALACLAGLGIDNAIVEVHGPELPIGDGSCAHFLEALDGAGTVEQDEEVRELVVPTPIEVLDEKTGAYLRAEPHDGHPVYRYELDYGTGSPIGAHAYESTVAPESFRAGLASARTFSTLQEAEAARSMGLFTHLSPAEMLVIGHDGPIENALRHEDEPARHKVVDMVGDLALTGLRLRGRFVGSRSGHALNHELARAILRQHEISASGSRPR